MDGRENCKRSLESMRVRDVPAAVDYVTDRAMEIYIRGYEEGEAVERERHAAGQGGGMQPAGKQTREDVDYHRRKGAEAERERIRADLLTEAADIERQPGMSHAHRIENQAAATALRDFANRLRASPCPPS